MLGRAQAEALRFARFLAHDPQVAQDVCQEGLARALGGIASLKDPRKLKSWLFEILRNVHRDFRRREAREVLAEAEEPSSGETSSERFDARQTLGRVSRRERSVIFLVDVMGHTYEEAARIIGTTEERVRSRLKRARARYQRLFNAA